MGAFNPDVLRAYADALADKRQMENVETCRRVPDMDQAMLLALNKPKNAKTSVPLPDAGTVTSWLQERLISVSTSDEQSAVLGLFYTNPRPFNVNPELAVGIFPLYSEITHYSLRPTVDLYFWEKDKRVTIEDESALGEDPFLVPNPQGPDFIFFKRSPFSDVNSYPAELPDPTTHYSGYHFSPRLKEDSLERNVITRALFFAQVASRKPRLFNNPGFNEFIRANKREPRYAELYAAYTRPQYKCAYGSDYAF